MRAFKVPLIVTMSDLVKILSLLSCNSALSLSRIFLLGNPEEMDGKLYRAELLFSLN